MKNQYMVIIIALLLVISFMFGSVWGTAKTIKIGASIIEQALDIKLSERSIQIIEANPNIIKFIIEESNTTYVNPYYGSHAVRFEQCMLTQGNYTGCVWSIEGKYGDLANVRG